MILEEWKEVLAISAVITTVLQFLTGTIVCQKIVQKGTTGDLSAFPFICGFLSSSMWLRYSFLIDEKSMILVNTIGSTLNLAYCVTYFMYSIKKSIILRQLLAALCLLMVMMIYSVYENNHTLAVSRVGIMCCVMAVITFASPLATLLHVIHFKTTESLPFPIIVSSFLVSLQWWLYGIILNDTFIQLPNFLGVVLSGFQLSLYLCFPRTAIKAVGYVNVPNTL